MKKGVKTLYSLFFPFYYFYWRKEKRKKKKEKTRKLLIQVIHYKLQIGHIIYFKTYNIQI